MRGLGLGNMLGGGAARNGNGRNGGAKINLI